MHTLQYNDGTKPLANSGLAQQVLKKVPAFFIFYTKNLAISKLFPKIALANTNKLSSIFARSFPCKFLV
jgi:hypothetical protein